MGERESCPQQCPNKAVIQASTRYIWRGPVWAGFGPVYSGLADLSLT